MARKSNAWYATQKARAAFELEDSFEELFEAASSLRDQGDFTRLEIVLDRLEFDPEYRAFAPLSNKMDRDERIAALAARYCCISQAMTRIEVVLDRTRSLRRELADQLRDAAAEPSDELPEYARLFFKRLQAEGIGQPDIHPASRAKAKVVAEAIRKYNVDRRQRGNGEHEKYLDHPIADWASLDPSFAGIELEDVPQSDPWFGEAYQLPPSTDIGDYTEDGVRAPFEKDRFSTLSAWSKIIDRWGKRNGVKLQGMQSAVWALLLAHRMPWDQSDITRLNGYTFQSPWTPGRVLRIVVTDQPPDDVPF